MVAAESGKTRATRGGPEVVSTADGHRRTRSDHAGETAEDYVELIDDLIKALGEARAVDLARYLGVTQVTVTNTIERLKREGLVTSKPYRSVFLTPKGRRLAAFTRRRHQPVLHVLPAPGVPRGAAEIDAEGIEHHLSTRTLAAMRKFVKQSQ